MTIQSFYKYNNTKSSQLIFVVKQIQFFQKTNNKQVFIFRINFKQFNFKVVDQHSSNWAGQETEKKSNPEEVCPIRNIIAVQISIELINRTSNRTYNTCSRHSNEPGVETRHKKVVSQITKYKPNIKTYKGGTFQDNHYNHLSIRYEFHSLLIITAF